MRLEEQIFAARFIDIFHFVGQARTAGGGDGQPQAEARPPLLKMAGNVSGSPLADGDTLRSRTFDGVMFMHLPPACLCSSVWPRAARLRPAWRNATGPAQARARRRWAGD